MSTKPSNALGDALASIGDRWSLLVIAALLDAPLRFGDLQQQLPGIAPNVLSQRLRQLERDGLVIAKPYSQRPKRLLYELTATGRELADVLRLLSDWGARRGSGEALRHQSCGTTLETRWYCPTCERITEDGLGDYFYI
jgi:DNA-binding HxlR family transcriptional regulator